MSKVYNAFFVLCFSDVGSIIAKLYPDTAPPITLVGHMMGGAICVRIASMKLIPSLIGCVVIDAVEGRSIEVFARMRKFLESRPQSLKSIQQAIQWSIQSERMENPDSVKVSMPGRIVK